MVSLFLFLYLPFTKFTLFANRNLTKTVPIWIEINLPKDKP